MSAPWSCAATPDVEKAFLDRVFARADTDNDGEISGREAIDLLLYAVGRERTSKRIPGTPNIDLFEQLWSLVDANRRGRLSRVEFYWFARGIGLLQARHARGVAARALTSDELFNSSRYPLARFYGLPGLEWPRDVVAYDGSERPRSSAGGAATPPVETPTAAPSPALAPTSTPAPQAAPALAPTPSRAPTTASAPKTSKERRRSAKAKPPSNPTAAAPSTVSVADVQRLARTALPTQRAEALLAFGAADADGDGRVGANDARLYFASTPDKHSRATLSSAWRMVDVAREGSLSRDAFIVMYLLLAKGALPDKLPASLAH